jgi:DNA primase catalytic core
MDALEQIKDIDIRELLPSSVDLNTSMVTCCMLPGHKERTPSWKYFPNKNSFHCYGCKRGGSVIDFWMHMQGMDFRTAIEDLAARYRIELQKFTPEQEKRILDDRQRELALTFAANYYADQLKPDTEQWAYLQGRGWSEETIRDLRLGWAGKTLYPYISRHPQKLTEAKLSEQDLVDAGVLRRNPDDQTIYEHLRNRIVFPLLKRGRCVGMSGRAFNDPAALEKGKKYVNLASAMPVLYCEDNIRNEVWLAEGLSDTVTLHQLGLPTVGLPGTSGIEKHLGKFARCQRVYLVGDTDDAGVKGAIKNGRLLHLAMRQGEVKVLLLPPHRKDVSEWVAAGASREDLVQLAANAPTLLDWLLGRVPDGLSPLESEQAIAGLLELVVPMGPVQRAQALDTIRGRFKGVKANDLIKMLKTIEGSAGQKDQTEGGPGGVIQFESRKERVPAQCYTFNSPAVGNMVVYFPVKRKTYNDDGEAKVSENWEPAIVTVTHDTGPMKVDVKLCVEANLSDGELARIPFAESIKGRWRIEGEHPYGVKRFLAGDVPHVSGWEMFSELREVYMTYAWMKPAPSYDFQVIYDMLTYVYQLFDALGYMHLTGVKSSGKSNIANLHQFLGFNATKSSNQTGAVMFRSQMANAGLRVFEECERFCRPKPGTPDFDVMLMLNDGYKRGANAERMREAAKESVQAFDLQSFDIYGPRILVGINELEGVLKTRTMEQLCHRATRDDLRINGIKDLTKNWRRELPRLSNLRDKLHVWALQNFKDVQHGYDTLDGDPDVDHLISRECEMWLPLLGIARHIDSQHAIALAGGDMAKAESTFQEWHSAWQQDPTRDETIFGRLVGLQREKEAVNRSNESEQSIDIAVIASIHQLVGQGEIGAATQDPVRGPLYAINDLAKLVTIDLMDLGIVVRDHPVSGRKLAAILYKTGAASHKDDFKEFMGIDAESGKRRTIRGIAIRLKALESTIERLGGRIATAS